MTHTPTPWRWDGGDLWHFGESYESEVDPHRYTGISIHRRLCDSEILKENMKLVIAAVNAHESLTRANAALVEALTRLADVTALADHHTESVNTCGICAAITQARAAIELASKHE